MRSHEVIRTPACAPCVSPSRLGAPTDTPLPYAAAPRTAGLVVRLPTWAGQSVNLPTWGSIYPPTRSLRMGQGPPDELTKFLPAFLHEPWVPGSLEGEEAGMTPSLDEGPAWWHLYPPPWQVRGPFDSPPRLLRLSRARGGLGAVLRPVVLRPQPWSWAGANYSWGVAPGRRQLRGHDSGWIPQSDGSVTAPDGSPGWLDNGNGTYTKATATGEGATIVSTVDAQMQVVATVVVPPGEAPPAGVPPPTGARSAAATTAADAKWQQQVLMIGGAAAALFLFAALVQKR